MLSTVNLWQISYEFMVNVLLAIVTGVTVKTAIEVGISFLALKKSGKP